MYVIFIEMSTCVTCFRVRAWIVEDLINKNDRYHLMKLNNDDLIVMLDFILNFFLLILKFQQSFM